MNYVMRFFLLSLLLGLPVYAGAARPGEPITFKPDALVPAAITASITLTEPLFFFEHSTSWAVPDMEMGLVAGTYVPTYEGGDGVFYVGPTPALFRGNAGKEMSLLKGGFWVPKMRGDNPRLFWIIGNEGVLVADNVDSLASAKPPKPARLGLLADLSYKKQIGNCILLPVSNDQNAVMKLKTIFQSQSSL